jgi:hypothetical protein
MKAIFITLFFCGFIGSSFAQNKCAIATTTAVFSVWIGGAPQTDNNGGIKKARRHFERSIYVTTLCKDTPIITSVNYDKTATKFSLQKIGLDEANSLKDVNEKPIKFIQSKGITFWKIDVLEIAGQPIPENPKNIVITQLIKKKKLSIFSKKEIELFTIPAP